MNGILFEDSNSNYVRGNRIGTTVNGETALGNGFGMILLSSANNDIRQNFVQSSTADGIILDGDGITGNIFRNNFIGGVEGLEPFGNGLSGVRIRNRAQFNNLGDRFTDGNTIQYNGRLGPADGITLEASADMGNLIDPTLFKGNSRMAIDLNGDGMLTPNDPGDADEGPNRLQNYPNIVSFNINGNGDLIVTYKVDSDPANSNYCADGLYVEFFISTTHKEGHTFLNADFFTEDDYNFGGNKTIVLGNAAALGINTGDRVTATASDASGNTSEFYPAYATPTAADASLSGKVTNANNHGVANIRITLTNISIGEIKFVTTNSIGDYRFDNIAVGETYIAAASSSAYTFAPPNHLVNLVTDTTDINFTALPKN